MDFDPYATWLGIPADRRPPTYYDLLGVAVVRVRTRQRSSRRPCGE